MADPIPSGPVPMWPGAFVQLDPGDLAAQTVFVRTAPVAADVAPTDAEPAVFVHGLGGSSRNWTDLMDLLSRPAPAASRTAVRPTAVSPNAISPDASGLVLASEALDLPGFGYSPVPPSGDYSLTAAAAAVIGLIEKRGRWPVHLIGNSLGGAISTRVAARRPDLVRSLMLISPAMPDLRPRLLPLRVAAVGLPWLGRWALTRLEAISAHDRTVGTIHDLYADPALIHNDRIREETEEVTRRDGLGYQRDVFIGSARALVTEYARWGPRSLWRDAARVTAPTLVLHGSHDRLVNPASAARAARVFRNVHVVLLPRVGHVAMMERPDLVARQMREFLTQSRAHPPVRAGELNQVTN